MKINDNETLFGIVGDTHGGTHRTQSLINRAHDLGVRSLFSVGDFGIWPGPSGRFFLDKVNETLQENDMYFYVTLGNHEDYNQVDDMVPDEEDGLLWFRDRIAVFPRPYRFNLGQFSVLSMGGAPSIDFQYRTPHFEWWPQEQITAAQAEEAVAGGHADIMITHDAPEHGTDAVQSILDYNPHGWDSAALAYAKEGRDIMTHIVSEVQPDLLFHGHYHVPDVGVMRHGGTICSLNSDAQTMSLATLEINEGLGWEVKWAN